jgi:hypothetical protein
VQPFKRCSKQIARARATRHLDAMPGRDTLDAQHAVADNGGL